MFRGNWIKVSFRIHFSFILYTFQWIVAQLVIQYLYLQSAAAEFSSPSSHPNCHLFLSMSASVFSHSPSMILIKYAIVATANPLKMTSNHLEWFENMIKKFSYLIFTNYIEYAKCIIKSDIWNLLGQWVL